MRSYIKTEWQLYIEAKIHTAVGSWQSKSIGRLLRTIFQRSKVLVHSWPDKRFISIMIGLQNDVNGNMIPDTQFSFPFTESSSCDPFHKSLSVCGYPHFIHVYLPLNNNSYVDKFCQRPCILRATKNFKLNRFTRFPFFIIILNKLPKKL